MTFQSKVNFPNNPQGPEEWLAKQISRGVVTYGGITKLKIYNILDHPGVGTMGSHYFNSYLHV